MILYQRGGLITSRPDPNKTGTIGNSIREAVASKIDPNMISYTKLNNKDLILKSLNALNPFSEREEAFNSNFDIERTNATTDIFRMFLKLPQNNNSWAESEYRPANSSDSTATYYKPTQDMSKYLDRYNEIAEEMKSEGKTRALASDVHAFAPYDAGDFTVSLGKDDKGEYLSYYDKYDIGTGNNTLSFENLLNKIGLTKPVEIYDRIYLNKVKGPGD